MPLLIAIAVLLIAGGVYYFSRKSQNSAQQNTDSTVADVKSLPNTNPDPSVASSTGVNKNEIDRYNQAIANRKAEEQANPPQGYLVPSGIPSAYNLTSSRFTSYSTFWIYHAQLPVRLGSVNTTTDVVLGYDETSKDTYDNYVKKAGNYTSLVEITRIVKNFKWNGSQGAVLGTFVNEKTYEMEPLKAGEYWLVYNHLGRLLRVHKTGDTALTPDVLISLLEKMTPAK